MTVETIDGVRVLKLSDHAPELASAADDTLTLVHIWRLLSGDHTLRDTAVGSRTYL